jgi:hypothetical protein
MSLKSYRTEYIGWKISLEEIFINNSLEAIFCNLALGPKFFREAASSKQKMTEIGRPFLKLFD